MDLLLDRGDRLLAQGRVLEQEGELLERAARRFRVEQEDDAELEEDPAAVDGEVAPGERVQSNAVDIGREEARQLAEDLLHADAAASLRIGPELDEVS